MRRSCCYSPTPPSWPGRFKLSAKTSFTKQIGWVPGVANAWERSAEAQVIQAEESGEWSGPVWGV